MGGEEGGENHLSMDCNFSFSGYHDLGGLVLPCTVANIVSIRLVTMCLGKLPTKPDDQELPTKPSDHVPRGSPNQA